MPWVARPAMRFNLSGGHIRAGVSSPDKEKGARITPDALPCLCLRKPKPPSSPARRSSLIDPRNLRAFEAEAGHQAFLAERKGVDVLRQRRRRGALGRALVDHHHARARADRPTVALVEISECLVVHQE